MKRVIIESPLSGNFERNIRYARLCMLDSLRRGEAPFLSHLLYTQVMDDAVPALRKLGMAAAQAWYPCADLCAVYLDLGRSGGMGVGIEVVQSCPGRIEVVERHLPPDLMEKLNGVMPIGTLGAS